MPEHKSLESLFHLVHILKRQLHEQVEQLELDITPMHARVMKIIDRKKPCTAVDIANFLDRDKAQVTRLVNTLIEKGLITRTQNPSDKRSLYLCITGTGGEVIRAIEKVDTTTRKIMMAGLTSEEIIFFQHIADKMANNIHSGLISSFK